MPKLKSSKKRLRQAVKARQRNRAVRSQLRTTLKKLRAAPTKTEAEALLSNTVSTIDRTAKKGIIHPNAAARYKSSLAKHIAAMQA